MIDIRTVILGYTVSNAVCAVVMMLLWLQNRKLFAGLGFWLACFVAQFIAALSFIVYGITQHAVFILTGNTLVVLGILLLYMGLERFAGKPGPQIHNYIFLATFFFAYAYFTFFQPDLLARNIIGSIAIFIIAFQCAWFTYRRVGMGSRAIITRRAGFIFIGYCLISIVRVLIDLSIHTGSDFIRSDEVDALFVLMYQMLLILLTFDLFLMINRRLVADLKNDFADRMQVQGALHERDELFHAIFDQAGVGVAQVLTTTWKIIRANQKYCDLVGYSREELEKLYIRDFTHPEDVQKNLDSIEQMIRGENRGFTMEKRYIRKDRKITWVNLTVSPMWEPGEEPTSHIAVVEDITERKQAAEKLRESEERLAAVMEGSQLGYSDWNIQTNRISRNERWAGMLGYTLEEIETSYVQWEDLVHSDDLISARRTLQDHLDGKTLIHRNEYRLRAKDGSYRWVLDQGMIIERAEDGHPLRLTATHTDVTERKQSEETLQKQYQYLSALQETTLELISEFDLDILLENIVRRAKSLVETKSGFLDLVDFEKKELKPHIGIGLLAESPEHIAQQSEGVAKIVWQTGKPLVVNDYDNWDARIKTSGINNFGSVIGVPLLSGDKVLGVLGLAYKISSGKTFGKETIEILMQFARLATIAIENARLFSAAQHANEQLKIQLNEIRELQDSLREQAIRDSLTGLYNRHYMEEAIRQEYARAAREGYPISIVILDLDHLKDINGKHGHVTGGDQALRSLGTHLNTMCRASDIVCRYGGDEFLIILHDAHVQAAYQRAEQWRQSLSKIDIKYDGIKFNISFSAGVAAFPMHGKNIEEVLLAADHALYHAKEAGRNCVKMYGKKTELRDC